MSKTATLERKQSLEEAIQQADHRSRDHALAELQSGIEKILHPRGGLTGYGGSPATHFIEIPKSPMTTLNRAGMPSGEVDEGVQAAFQQELQRITIEERRLRDLAQQAKGMISPLFDWAVDLGKAEDRLLLSVLSEEDRSDVEAFCREHRRLMRTIEKWISQLVF